MPATARGQSPSIESGSGADAVRTVAVEHGTDPGERGGRPQDEQARKSPVVAAILGAYVPLAGYAYAGRWKRGLAPQALWIAGFAGMAYAGDCEGGDGASECSGTRETVGGLGWVSASASVFWGGIGAFRTARAYNRGLEEGLRIELRPAADGGMSVGFRVLLPR